jgi:hypothetical protein
MTDQDKKEIKLLVVFPWARSIIGLAFIHLTSFILFGTSSYNHCTIGILCLNVWCCLCKEWHPILYLRTPLHGHKLIIYLHTAFLISHLLHILQYLTFAGWHCCWRLAFNCTNYRGRGISFILILEFRVTILLYAVLSCQATRLTQIYWGTGYSFVLRKLTSWKLLTYYFGLQISSFSCYLFRACFKDVQIREHRKYTHYTMKVT